MSLSLVRSSVMAKYLAFIWFLLNTAVTHNFRALSLRSNLRLTVSLHTAFHTLFVDTSVTCTHVKFHIPRHKQ